MDKEILEKNEEKFNKQIFPIKGLSEKEIRKFTNRPNGKLMALPKKSWQNKFYYVRMDTKNPFMVLIGDIIIQVRNMRLGSTPKGYTFADKRLKVQDCYLLRLGRIVQGVIVE